MSANIFGKRFYSHREPAWHNIGTVLEEPLAAKRALEFVGEYKVSAVPLQTVRGDPVPYKAIIRGEVPEDPYERTLGIVSSDYVLVSPQDVCDLWDEHVARPVETLGALGKYGNTIFISTRMPSFKIKDDDIDNYLLVVSPMGGGEAFQMRVTPVRVVCQNTLIAAQAKSLETYRVIHNQYAKVRIGEWLGAIWDIAEAHTTVLQAAFNILSSKKLETFDARRLLSQVYPNPSVPLPKYPGEPMSDRIVSWERYSNTISNRREAVLDLFQGEATGAEAAAFKGTAWGFYNSVVEAEDYRWGMGDKAIARSALAGGRASTKAHAFQLALDIAR